MRADFCHFPRRSPGSPPLTLPSTRSKSPAARATADPAVEPARYVNVGTALDGIRRSAALAAPSDLSLATHLRFVDPAPRRGPGADRGCDLVGVVARRCCFRTRRLRKRHGFSRFLARASAVVRLVALLVLPFVQRDPASR